ncbi:hypothetical protein [Candidatus Burkholderia verschuerenii]|nr:hypothetical protein [Candidatus Burkholderia verschuerenii]
MASVGDQKNAHHGASSPYGIGDLVFLAMEISFQFHDSKTRKSIADAALI